MTALAERIEAATGELVEETVREMYRDPFWLDRFGERGQTNSRTDGAFHVSYLTRALAAGGPETLEIYARWLQTLLLARGMCSLHLDQHFARLDEALQSRGLDEQGTAKAYLTAARRALRHPGIAGELAGASGSLLDQAGRGLWPARLRELEVLQSFLADALALGTPERLAGHLAWLRDHHRRSGVEAAVADDLLERLRTALGALERLPAEARTAALDCLSRATAGEQP